jgi:hypothetical protein
MLQKLKIKYPFFVDGQPSYTVCTKLAEGTVQNSSLQQRHTRTKYRISKIIKGIDNSIIYYRKILFSPDVINKVKVNKP